MAREHNTGRAYVVFDERKIEFLSEGTVCRGTVHLPQSPPHDPRAKPPGVVLAHGFGGTADCTSLVSAARRFARAGIVALVFDYRYFGASDGTPRQKLSTIAQRTDYHAALAFLRASGTVDPERCGLWGTSFSGAHTLFVAEQDGRIRACVAQVPALDLKASSALIRTHRSPADERLLLATPPDQLVPLVATHDGDAAIFMSSDSYKFRTVECPTASHWVNGVLSSAWQHGDLSLNDPSTHLRTLHTPTLVQVANHDDLNSTEGSVKYALGQPKASLLRYDGRHFDIYQEPTAAHAHRDAISFFLRHL